MSGRLYLPSASPRPWAARKPSGASRLEVLIVVILIGIVGALLLERLTRYQEYAEKAVMEATIANMRSGLRLRVAELMLDDRMGEAGQLLQQNPLAWLAVPPSNYGGLLTSSDISNIQRGKWYFDAAQRQLVYLPLHRRFFQPAIAGAAEVRLQLMARMPAAGLTRTPTGRIEGFSLLLLTPYRWSEAI